jgi:hypothetical protein
LSVEGVLVAAAITGAWSSSHTLDQAWNPAQAGGCRSGEPLAPRDDRVAAAAASHQERLQHAMPPDRLDEGRRTDPRRRRDAESRDPDFEESMGELSIEESSCST